MVEDSLETILKQDGNSAQPDGKNDAALGRTEEMIDCIGKRCHLEQYPKKFRSVSVEGRAGPKKCPSCKQFEPALNKALQIEKYILQQLEEPTDDIFRLLEGLSSLMEGSKNEVKAPRGAYYDEILAIPQVKVILKLPEDRTPDGTCPPSAKMALVMIAATFGIALDGPAISGPFPGITTDAIRKIWDMDLEGAPRRDTWKQLCWFIQHLSITTRMRKLEKRLIPLNQAQKRVLQRAEKCRRLDERPASLATAIPRRKHGGWDENTSRKKSKIEIVDAAIAIANDSSEKMLQGIHQVNITRGYREMAKANIKVAVPPPNLRTALGDITNKSQRDNNPNSKGPKEKNAADRKRKRCNLGRNETGQQLMLSQVVEAQQLASTQPTFSHLKQLNMERIAEVTTPQLLISSDHINSLIDIIHARTNRQDLSIVNTAFCRELLDAKGTSYEQAQRYLQPDEETQRISGSKWKRQSHRIKATASSTVLLIPCHLERANHWILTARIKVGGGRHKFFIFDSLGVATARKRTKRIPNLLKKIGLYGKQDTCSILDLKVQTEHECGARISNYIKHFSEWVTQSREGAVIINKMNRGIADEKQGRFELATESRRILCDTLRCEKLKH